MTQKGQKIWKSFSSSDQKHLKNYVQKLIIYELDSCLHLQEWAQIKQIIQKMTALYSNTFISQKSSENKVDEKKNDITKHEAFFLQCVVDLLLNCGELPLDNLVECLRLIVTENFGVISNETMVELSQGEKNNEIETATKWTRILVGLTLPGREDTCVDVLTHFREFLRGQGKVIMKNWR